MSCVILSRRNKALVNELSTPPPGAKDLYFPSQYSQSTWGQFRSCLWKQWLTYWRSPDYNLVRYFFTLAAALIVGAIFWKVGTKMYVNILITFISYHLHFISSSSSSSSSSLFLLTKEFFA